MRTCGTQDFARPAAIWDHSRLVKFWPKLQIRSQTRTRPRGTFTLCPFPEGRADILYRAGLSGFDASRDIDVTGKNPSSLAPLTPGNTPQQASEELVHALRSSWHPSGSTNPALRGSPFCRLILAVEPFGSLTETQRSRRWDNRYPCRHNCKRYCARPKSIAEAGLAHTLTAVGVQFHRRSSVRKNLWRHRQNVSKALRLSVTVRIPLVLSYVVIRVVWSPVQDHKRGIGDISANEFHVWGRSKLFSNVHLVGLISIFLGMDEEEVVDLPGHEDIFFVRRGGGLGRASLFASGG